MATDDAVLKINGSQLLFADHAGDFGAAPNTAANTLIIGTPVDIQLDSGSLAVDGGRQSTKSASLGSERTPIYRVDACIEFATAPADGGTVEFYWGGSANSTAATGNPASLTGADAAFTDTAGLLGQLTFIGSLSLENDVINIGYVGKLVPDLEYGSLVVINSGSTAFATTADEIHVTFTPITFAGEA